MSLLGAGPKRAREKAEGPARLPDGLSVPTGRGESVLAAAHDDLSDSWVALTTFRFVVLSTDGQIVLDRPWHEIDTGAWDPDSATLSLGFVDGARAFQWRLRTRTGPGRIPQVFRERVSASVVQVREVKLGPRRTARISVRSVLSMRQLTDQVALGRGADPRDGELAAEVDRVRRELRDEVGMPPPETR